MHPLRLQLQPPAAPRSASTPARNARGPAPIAVVAFAMLGILAETTIAQVVPTNPRRFGKRDTGESSRFDNDSGVDGTGIGVRTPTQEPAVQRITYVTLSETREWTSTDGRKVEARLVAFEEMRESGRPPSASPDSPPSDTAAEKPDGPAAEEVVVQLERPPTVIRDGKIRFLRDGKVYVFPLERLGEADRELVRKIEAAARKPPAEPPPAPASSTPADDRSRPAGETREKRE